MAHDEHTRTPRVVLEAYPCIHDPRYEYISIPVIVMTQADTELRQREAWLQHLVSWPRSGNFRK